MKKIIMALMAACLAVPAAIADPLKDDEYFTMHSMGCMILRECTDDVDEVSSLLDVSSQYDNTDSFYLVANEF